MFKLIALNYTVMRNSQWLNIKGKNIDISDAGLQS